jgi:uncharacterized SAM-binding protein YcdF (DUF218 family)
MAFDLRKYARQTNLRLVAGFTLILFLIGDGLIWMIYGREAAILGFICLLAGLFPLVLISLVLWAMDWFVKRQNE